MARVAFCFHHSQPSGASLWLKRFLISRRELSRDSIAVLPAWSSVADELKESGYAVHEMGLSEQALSEAGASGAAAILLNRVGAVGRYGALFKREGVRVVYANSSVNLAPLVAASMQRIPTIVHVHEIPTAARLFGPKRATIRRLATACLFASQKGMEVFGPVPPGRTWEFSPNGVDPALCALSAQKQDFRARLGYRADAFIVLFLGNLSEAKGVHQLSMAWKELAARHPGAELLVAGAHDPGRSHAAIDELVAGRVPRATFLGFRKDAAELMALADLFVLPSRTEAMPLSIVEAMMIGTPVLARNVGDVGWLLAEGRGRLYEQEEALEGRLEEAISHPGENLEMGRRAQEFARTSLTADAQYRQIERLIGSLV
jgi:glycosyltransferase involved in cell wall biosynthesis